MENDFRSLPESMESEDLAECFMKFLEEYGEKPKNMIALKQLYELAYRQWDTYEMLREDIAEKIEAYLMAAMNLRSYEVTDVILSIVENLTLKNVFAYIVGEKDNVSIPAVRHLIIEAEEEYGDSIEDPYSSDEDWF